MSAAKSFDRPDLRAKREAWAEAIKGRTVTELFTGDWILDTSEEPDTLAAFYFREGLGVSRMSADDFNRLSAYITQVLSKRRDHLQRAYSLLRQAACLNDLNAVARYRLLADSIESIIKAYEDLNQQIQRAFFPPQGFMG